MKVVKNVSDPPQLTADDIKRLADEGARMSDEFMRRTAAMERNGDPMTSPSPSAAARALLAAATPAPWKHWIDPECPDDVRVCYARDGEHCEWCVALSGDTIDGTREWTPETLARWHADAALIAAAPTLLAQLCDQLDAAREELGVLRRDLAEARMLERDARIQAEDRGRSYQRVVIELDEARAASGITAWAGDVRLAAKFATQRDTALAEAARLRGWLSKALDIGARLVERDCRHWTRDDEAADTLAIIRTEALK